MASSLPLLLSVFLFLSASQAFRVEVEPDATPSLVPPTFYMAGKPELDRVVSLYIGLTPSNKEELTRTLHDIATPSSPMYGKWWTKKQVDEFVAPTAETQQKVLSWLMSEDVISAEEKAVFEAGKWLKNEKLVQKTVLFWELKCTVAEAQRLLGVTFVLFRNIETDAVYVRTTEKYSVPFEVSSAISMVGNVYRFPSNLVVHTERSVQSPQGLSITPEILLARYNVTIPPYNAKNVQAVASFLGQYYSDSDTALYAEDFFPGVDCKITKTVGDNDQSNPGIEAALDTQYIQFGNCSVTTWDYSTSGESDLGNEPFLKWLLEVDAECTASFCPYVYSMSYGDYENTITDAYAASVDFEFQMISLTGRTFLAASGDGGVGCADIGYAGGFFNCTYFNSIFISTSPHVVSVGATTSSLERAAGFSGGGFSDKFSRPTYQGDAVESYFTQGQDIPPTSFFNKYGRGFPDVGVAGTEYLVYWKGKRIPVDGTSASTPAMASMISMMNSERLSAGLPTMGLANPFLYSASASNPASFVDVTSGSTQSHGCCPTGFTPVEGWEPFCGLGAPDYGVLADMALSSSFIPALRK